MNTRNVVRISIIAALYTVLTVGLAPISYGPLQFRIAEFLKVFVLYNPWLSIGIGIGTFFANLSSPYVGPLELIWMPLTDITGGILAWIIFKAINNRYPVIPMAVYAITTALAVGVMLYILGVGGTIPVALSIWVSEIIIFIGGLVVSCFWFSLS
jgi:uncharacterized membrane protein